MTDILSFPLDRVRPKKSSLAGISNDGSELAFADVLRHIQSVICDGGLGEPVDIPEVVADNVIDLVAIRVERAFGPKRRDPNAA